MADYLMIFQATISILLIITVLLQFGKGAEAGLMQSATDSVFTSAQQGNILSKLTTVLAILFLGNSLLLAKIQTEKSSTSILDDEAPVSRTFNDDPNAKKDAPAATEPKVEAKTESKTEKK